MRSSMHHLNYELNNKWRLFAIILLMGLSCLKTIAQNYDYIWGKRLGATSLYDNAAAIASDTSGNVYVTGDFDASIIAFDSLSVSNTYTNKKDIFITKFDLTGKAIWAKGAGGKYSDFARAVATDLNNNVYLAGTFDTATLWIGSTGITHNGATDILIAKYTAAGTLLWAKGIGGTLVDDVKSIRTDKSGNLYVVGYFYSPTIQFDSIALTHTGAAHTRAIFIAKYNAAGKILWAKKAGGYYNDAANSICIDQNDQVYVTGTYDSPNITFDNFTLTKVAATDMFVVKYTSAGKAVWAKSAGGNIFDNARAATTDNNGNIFVAGSFTSASIKFDTISIMKTDTFKSPDVFVVKYNGSGNALWAKVSKGSEYDEPNSVTADPDNNFYVTGQFMSGAIIFGGTTLTNTTKAGGVSDVFVTKYAPDGKVLWAKGSEGTAFDIGNSIVCDKKGNAYVVGNFNSASIRFGTSIVNNSYGFDSFMAKLGNIITGFENPEKETPFLIYPNPSNGIFQLSSGLKKIKRICIYNLFGAKIYDSPVQIQQNSNVAFDITIDLSNQPTGVYLFQIVSEDDTVYPKKIVLNKRR